MKLIRKNESKEVKMITSRSEPTWFNIKQAEFLLIRNIIQCRSNTGTLALCVLQWVSCLEQNIFTRDIIMIRCVWLPHIILNKRDTFLSFRTVHPYAHALRLHPPSSSSLPLPVKQLWPLTLMSGSLWTSNRGNRIGRDPGHEPCHAVWLHPV